MTVQVVYTFEDVAKAFTTKAAGYIARRYRNYSVDFDDALQECSLWLYTHEKKVRNWLSKSPQQTTRIYMEILQAGLRYAEQEKAAVAGYDVEDVMWYTPTLVEGLLPLALDETYVGASEDGDDSRKRKPRQPDQGGDGLALVMDIRRAIKSEKLTEFFYHHDSTHPLWEMHIQRLVDRLGGNSPYVGRRKPLANSQAIAITHSQESE